MKAFTTEIDNAISALGTITNGMRDASHLLNTQRETDYKAVVTEPTADNAIKMAKTAAAAERIQEAVKAVDNAKSNLINALASAEAAMYAANQILDATN